jgi:hypothetical protein
MKNSKDFVKLPQTLIKISLLPIQRYKDFLEAFNGI